MQRRPRARLRAFATCALAVTACRSAPRVPAGVGAATDVASSGVVRTPDGARLAYTVVPAVAPGRPARTFVVLHGGPGATHNYLRPEWDRLAAFGRVVYYDQRGCGASTRTGPYTWQTHVRDLGVVLDSLAPGERVVLAGSSWGSWLAVTFAHAEAAEVARRRRSRVGTLVLSGVVPWPARPSLTASQRDSLPDELRYHDPAIDTVPVARRVPVTLAVPARRAGVPPRQFALCLGAAPSPRNFAGMPPLEALRDVTTPALLVVGADTTGPNGWLGDDLLRALPNARREVIAGAGHDPWFEQPDAFFAALRRFLSR